MRAFLLSMSLALVLGGEAMAQAIGSQAPWPRVDAPQSELPPADKPSDYLKAAQTAVAAGMIDRAEEALEHAQTRLLDRSVPLFQTGKPSSDPLSQQITQARQTLAAHDRNECLRWIQTAIESATAQGL